MLDLSTNPLDFQTLVSGKELLAQEIFRIALNAGVMEYLNEQMDKGKVSYLQSTIANKLQEFEKVKSVESVEASFANETLILTIRVVSQSNDIIDASIDLDKLTVDLI